MKLSAMKIGQKVRAGKIEKRVKEKKNKLSAMKVGQKSCVKVKAGWLARDLEPKNKQLVPRVAGQLEYSIDQTFAFCVALLEDVNAHDEAKVVNTYFNKMLGVIEDEGEAP